MDIASLLAASPLHTDSSLLANSTLCVCGRWGTHALKLLLPRHPGCYLVEDAPCGEMLVLSELPSAKVGDRHQLGLRKLGGIFRGDRGVARTVEIPRGNLLSFG